MNTISVLKSFEIICFQSNFKIKICYSDFQNNNSDNAILYGTERYFCPQHLNRVDLTIEYWKHCRNLLNQNNIYRTIRYTLNKLPLNQESTNIKTINPLSICSYLLWKLSMSKKSYKLLKSTLKLLVSKFAASSSDLWRFRDC